MGNRFRFSHGLRPKTVNGSIKAFYQISVWFDLLVQYNFCWLKGSLHTGKTVVDELLFMSFPLFSAAPCVGTEEQRVQRQAYNVASLPQPSATEWAAHAAECHLPRILHSGQHDAPQFSPFAGKQLSKLTGKRQQRHLPSFTIQLRPRQSIPDARWDPTLNHLSLFLLFFRTEQQQLTSLLFVLPPSWCRDSPSCLHAPRGADDSGLPPANGHQPHGSTLASRE